MKTLFSCGLVMGLCTLVSCGPLYSRSDSQELFLEKLGEVVSGKAQETEPDPRSVLTRSMLNQTEATILLAELPSRDSVSTQAAISANGGKITWSGSDETQFTTQQGFLVATRALGEDLMWVDVEGFGAALSGRSGGRYTRKMAWLGSMDDVKVEEFTCSVALGGSETLNIVEKSFQTRVYRDTCVGSVQQFENVYWIDSEQKLRKSQQFVSESVGNLLIERLN